MKNKHANISIFVPHIGCTNQCTFCNQRHITGVSSAPDKQDIIDAVNIAKASTGFIPQNTEIAFFGGSFTAIDRDYMISLLECAYTFVSDGTVCGIRCSTRPDAIDKDVLDLLKNYGVTSIELGAQSLDDNVLALNKRGHTAQQVRDASLLIKEYGFSLGLQMMTGLLGDTDELSIKTAKEIVALKPDTVRIYPTIVLKDTELESLYLKNLYKPQTLAEAVNLCSDILPLFYDNGINVIRLGLHTIDEKSYVAGPWHPAFSELCTSNIYFKKAQSLLKEKGSYNLFVTPSDVSKAVGQKRMNVIKLSEAGYDCKVVPDSHLKEFELIAERRD